LAPVVGSLAAVEEIAMLAKYRVGDAWWEVGDAAEEEETVHGEMEGFFAEWAV
jgi:hypothetical protein